jgi:hypothetical protein
MGFSVNIVGSTPIGSRCRCVEYTIGSSRVEQADRNRFHRRQRGTDFVSIRRKGSNVVTTFESNLLNTDLQVVNIGAQGFAADINAVDVTVVHVDWQPPAGGDADLAALLGTQSLPYFASLAHHSICVVFVLT